MSTSYTNYATLPSVIISDGILPVPIYAVTQMGITQMYSLPNIVSTSQKAILPVHDDTITITGQLVGIERQAMKVLLETMAEASKRGTALEAYTGGKASGLILISSMTIRTNLQVSTLQFTVNNTKRECIDLVMTLKHIPTPGMLDKLFDIASIGISALADIGE